MNPNKKGLIYNSSIKWDDEMISEFLPNMEVEQCGDVRNLWEIFCSNAGIQWTDELMMKYEWDYSASARNKSFHWSPERIEEYKNESNKWVMMISNIIPMPDNFEDEYPFMEPNINIFLGITCETRLEFPWFFKLLTSYYRSAIDEDYDFFYFNHQDDEGVYNHNSRGTMVKELTYILSNNQGIYNTFVKNLDKEEVDRLMERAIANKKIIKSKNNYSSADEENHWYVTKDPLYDSNRDMDQQDPEIW